jgi:hypothetical protein
MQTILDLVSKALDLPLERLDAFIALAALAVAFFAIYAVLTVVMQRSGR